MSERVSDERLKVMTREGYRLASGCFVDEEIAAMARELIERRALDRPDDVELITAEWLWQSGFYRECDYGGDLGWFAKDFDDGTPDWLTVNPEECEVTIINDDGGSVTRDISTRGELRRLWVALTGKDLES